MTDHRPEVRELLKQAQSDFEAIQRSTEIWLGPDPRGKWFEKYAKHFLAALSAPPIEPVEVREALEELRNAATNVFPHGTVEAMQRWHKAFNNANAALAAKEAEARDWQVLLNKRDTLQAELARCREALEQIAKHTKDERTKAWATAALQPERGEQG